MGEIRGNILLVEDNEDEAILFKMMLEPEGYEIIWACNGKEGLEKVESSAPDLIVLDVMMPELDGFAVCSILKESPEYCDIPVILLTAVAQHIGHTHYALDGVIRAGAEEYLEKPVKPEDLIETVGRLLA